MMRRTAFWATACLLLLGGCDQPRTGATTPAETCTPCHGDPLRPGDELRRAAPPTGVHLDEDEPGSTDTSYPGVGAHEAHLWRGDVTQPLECTECHVVPTVDGQLYAEAPGHFDGAGLTGEDNLHRAVLTFDGRAVMGGVAASYDYDTHTCTTYCHGATLKSGTNTSPVWNEVGTGQGDCGTCHGLPPVDVKHPKGNRCWLCHPSMKADGTLDPALHINGKVEVDTVTCHSCHGSTDNDAPPVDSYGRSDTTLPSVGAHQAHVREGTMARAFDCTECHVKPTANDPFMHIDGTAEITFGALAATGHVTPSYSGGTCVTYCHAPPNGGGTNREPQWTKVDGSQSACGTCHALPPVTATHPRSTKCWLCHPTANQSGAISDKNRHVDGVVDVINDWTCNRCHGSAANPAPPTDTLGRSDTSYRSVGAHQAHVAPTNGLTAPLACSACHNPVPTAADPRSHIDGVVEVSFGGLASTNGVTPTWDGTTCNVYCHGVTLPGGTARAPVWTTVDGTQAACTACHAMPPAAPHPLESATSCGTCHLNVSRDGSGNWVFADPSLHVNGTVEVKTFTCHDCHGSTDNPAPPVDTQGRSDTSLVSVGAHQAHVQGGLYSDPIACTECHPVPTDLRHVDGIVDLSFGPLATARGATASFNGTTCDNYCHGQVVGGGTNTTPNWTGGPSQAQCGSCHSLPPVDGIHPPATLATCVNCHGTVVNANLTWKNRSLHINGRVDLGQ